MEIVQSAILDSAMEWHIYTHRGSGRTKYLGVDFYNARGGDSMWVFWYLECDEAQYGCCIGQYWKWQQIVMKCPHASPAHSCFIDPDVMLQQLQTNPTIIVFLSLLCALFLILFVTCFTLYCKQRKVSKSECYTSIISLYRLTAS